MGRSSSENPKYANRRVNPRATAAVSAFRQREIYELLCMGKSRTDIVHFCAENYDIGERQADVYIQKARDLLNKDAELTRPMFLAEVLGRLRTYENAAAKRGQLKVAVESVALQSKLVGLDK